MNFLQRYMISVLVVLLAVIANHLDGSCVASVQMQQKPTQNDYLSNELPQEKIDQHNIPKDQTLILRLPSNTLLKYTSYKDVSILHFSVPPDTRTAYFTFKAYEESKSAFRRKCKPRDVTVHLKAGSYPVISPENITFPRNYLNAQHRFKIYNLHFKSDEVQQRVIVDGPYIGNWFAIAFISWTDPNNERIEQQGLSATCETLLLAEMSVTQFRPIILNDGQKHSDVLTSRNTAYINQFEESSLGSNESTQVYNLTKPLTASASPITNSKQSEEFSTLKESVTLTENDSTDQEQNIESESPIPSSKKGRNDESKFNTNNHTIYKFYVPPDIGDATAYMTIDRALPDCPDVGFYIQANAFPNPFGLHEHNKEINYIHTSIIKPNQTGEISIEFFVQPGVWHYAFLVFVNETNVTASSGPSKMQSAAKLKLLNELQNNPSRRSDPDSGLGNEKLQQQRLLNFNKVKNLVTKADQSGNETDLCSLEYSLQINFKQPFEDHLTTTPKPKMHSGDDDDIKATPLLKADGTTMNSENGTSSKSHEHEEAKPNAWKPIRFRNMDFYQLLRQTYREFFMFDYDLMPDINGTVPAVLNLTGGTPAGFAFEIGEVYDIGGTLSFAMSMKLGLKFRSDVKNILPINSQSSAERGGILAEKLIAPSGHTITRVGFENNNKKSLSRNNKTIIVCMNFGEPGEPTWPDKCRYGRNLLPASSIVNNTEIENSSGLIHVPFPESGQWYITMALYCHGAETAARATIIDSVKSFVKAHAYMLNELRSSCACYDSSSQYLACVNDSKCFTAMNETETLKVKECLMDSKCTVNYVEMTRKFENHHKQHFAVENCNTSVIFTISSSPCVVGRCGRFGRCYHYMSGGFVFSTCVCMKGYRGWDCTEDTQVPSSISILMASLLLTLSNLLFFPSIYIAMRRKYYTEGIIYFFAMFFSIFYHACDSGEDEYSFCLVKIGVLQFCDFYCGLLAIWVTLVAMSHIPEQFVSLLHMFGAIMLAFGTELNKQSLWVFLAPALTGICLISASWGLRCYTTHKWFPTRKYLTIYMPLGMVLVMVGLVCYAFLQTKQNYHIVHSVWHMVMALSILCLLPSRKSFKPKC